MRSILLASILASVVVVLSACGPQKSFRSMPEHGTEAICAVTQTPFVIDEQTTTSVYDGRVYVFCCPGCKARFDADPKKYS